MEPLRLLLLVLLVRKQSSMPLILKFTYYCKYIYYDLYAIIHLMYKGFGKMYIQFQIVICRNVSVSLYSCSRYVIGLHSRWIFVVSSGQASISRNKRKWDGGLLQWQRSSNCRRKRNGSYGSSRSTDSKTGNVLF